MKLRVSVLLIFCIAALSSIEALSLAAKKGCTFYVGCDQDSPPTALMSITRVDLDGDGWYDTRIVKYCNGQVDIQHYKNGMRIVDQSNIEIDINTCSFNIVYDMSPQQIPVTFIEWKDDSGNVVGFEYNSDDLDTNGSSIIYFARVFYPDTQYDVKYLNESLQYDIIIDDGLRIVKEIRIQGIDDVIGFSYSSSILGYEIIRYIK